MSQKRRLDLKDPATSYFAVGIAFVAAGLAFVASGQPIWVVFFVLGVVFASIGFQERAQAARAADASPDPDAGSSPPPSGPPRE